MLLSVPVATMERQTRLYDIFSVRFMLAKLRFYINRIYMVQIVYVQADDGRWLCVQN